ncbi:hypothetical protein BCV70DRAFT_207318 [Testicularia cyperi]|uniref:Protein OS-9 homolog n=1 Tax=Testicularia cyperi TaxID=1882483 RepID=A0A317XLD6_9BASI|nr:hypothetical protein BCV70DRAFT_207318 [Testicularia cyperi]
MTAPARIPQSWLLLLTALCLHAALAQASISSSFSFPQDVFSKPAFDILLGGATGDALALPIRKSAAVAILEQQGARNRLTDIDMTASGALESSLALAHRSASSSDSPHTRAPLLWTVQRVSPISTHLCAIPDFSATRTQSSKPNVTSTVQSRHDLIRSAQRLLDPLKKRCLYHTVDWFTYSFCHGREVRQFRLLTPQSAASDALKRAGGGQKGEKAAIEAAQKVASQREPIADPAYPAFTLGRWRPQNDEIIGDDHSPAPQGSQTLSEIAGTTSSTPLLGSSAYVGTDLVEEVQFGDWDEEELFAAEAKVLATLGEASRNGVKDDSEDVHAAPDAHTESSAATSGSSRSNRHRYITQTWSDGTLCDLNNQPRTIEVQFHCSHRKPAIDRIVLIKETTICNYVLMIETPRLCNEPAFAGEKEEATQQVRCHRVVDDAFRGLTLGDAHASGQTSRDTEASADTAASTRRSGEQSNAEPGPREHAETTGLADNGNTGESHDGDGSHTYGDLAQYRSIYDDYYDEALGKHGPEYERIKKDHMQAYYGHNPDQTGDDYDAYDQQNAGGSEALSGDQEQEAYLYVELDEDGNVNVQTLSEAEAAEEARQKSGSGKRRTSQESERSNTGVADAAGSGDHEEDILEIQLEVEDLMDIMAGRDAGLLEKKLADRLSQKLHKIKSQQDQQEQDHQDVDQDQRKKSYQKDSPSGGQLQGELAAVYKRLMKAIDGTGHTGAGADNKRREEAVKKEASQAESNAKKGPGEFEFKPQAAGASRQQQQQSQQQRMAKVGDSLAERAKRFYDAKDRDRTDQSAKSDNEPRPGKTAPKQQPQQQHVEL